MILKRFFLLLFSVLLTGQFIAPGPSLSWAQTTDIQAPPEQLYVFDLEAYLQNRPNNRVWQYDVINMVSALQGLVNRDQPQLYILFVHERLSGRHINVDEYWLEKLRRPGGYFEKTELVYIQTLEELISTFRDYFTATTLWDPDVPATGNIAVTIAGTDGFLPLRHDPSPGSLFNQIQDEIQIPTGERLSDKFPAVGTIPDTAQVTTRVKKNDAYRWAKEFYLDTGLSSATHFGFFLDPYDWDPRAEGFQYPDLENCMIVNHDYYVAKRAFFVDLDPWWDEVPTDIPHDPFVQGIDQKTLQLIMQSAYENTVEGERIIRVGGFVPWWIKYSNYGNIGGKHPPAETVERFVGFMSAYNGIIDGGGWPFAALANASLYQHIPMPERYFQNPVPPPQPLEDKNYLLFVMGDFDSSSMLYQTIPILWDDLDRGTLPLAWALSPIMSERVPHVFDYMYRTRTANDYFVSGTAGAGLNYPNRFKQPREYSNLGNDLFFWEKIANALYQKFDIFISVSANLDREQLRSTVFNKQLQEEFMAFSPHGVSTLKPYDEALVNRVIPFIEETGNFKNRTLALNQVAQEIHDNAESGTPKFHLYRFNLANPTAMNYLYQLLRSQRPDLNYEILDPYSFFYLYRQHRAGNDPSANYLIPNYISNTIPRELLPGSTHEATVTLRNDGWDTWNGEDANPSQRYRLSYRWQLDGGIRTEEGAHAAYVDRTVMPGERITLPILIEPPTDLLQQGGALFNLTLVFERENQRESFIQHRIRVVVE